MSLVTTEVANKIGWLTLNRPEKLNAFSAELLAEFESTLDQLSQRDDVAVIVLSGAGRAFSVGYDVSSGPTESSRGSENSGYGGDGNGEGRVRALDDWLNLRHKIDVWLKVWRCPKPVIAEVHGYCMGGATMLAVCCDLTIIAEDAIVGWPSVPLGGGLIGPVSAWLLGPKKAKEMSYIVGSRMTGQEAADWGWANYAVPADQLRQRTKQIAGRVARTPIELLQVKKRALNRVMDMQGFSEVVMFGAEFDAIAHDSVACDVTKAEIREHGLKETIARYTAQEAS